jgi:hypothetical protein
MKAFPYWVSLFWFSYGLNGQGMKESEIIR